MISSADVTLFATGVPHPEGIAVARDGWLYTGSALPDHRGIGPIYRIAPDGSRVETFADSGGRALGLAFDRAGNLFACDVERGAVLRVDPDGNVHLFADHVDARRLQKPNFLVFDRQGRLYVSDSGTAKAGEPTGAIFCFTSHGQGEVWLDGLTFANGLALTPDEAALYAVETRDNRVLRVPIRDDGTAGAPSVYVAGLDSGPDGLAVDVAGYLYVTITRPSRIVRVSPRGERTEVAFDPRDELLHAPSNLAFGGPDGRDLYIANLFGQHISCVRVETPGMPLYHQATHDDQP